jgi:putative Mg2+ transporter-C (MgtC) family protein
MNETLDIIIRIAAGAGFGAIIGFERQWRARTAGLRTNTLVAVGATLFVLLGAYGFGESVGDPARVAAQVVTGVGFLGAGVIMKQGTSVTGINTAATLWGAAAVGSLAGAGRIWVAAIGTAAVVGANVLLRPRARALDDGDATAGREQGTQVEYTFEVRCHREYEVSTRSLVFAAVGRPTLTVKSIGAADLPDDLVVITAVARSKKRNDYEMELAVADVVPVPEVLGVRWTAENLEPED